MCEGAVRLEQVFVSRRGPATGPRAPTPPCPLSLQDARGAPMTRFDRQNSLGVGWSNGRFLAKKGIRIMTTVSYENVDQAIEQVTPTIERIVNDVWQLSELSLQEVRSARLLMEILQENGFIITSKGTAGVPTAFIAEYGSGTPLLGFLTHYGRLPALGHKALPHLHHPKSHV